MMSRYSTCGCVPFRWIRPLFSIMTFALLSAVPIGAAAQDAGLPVFVPGLHELTLRSGSEILHRTISGISA